MKAFCGFMFLPASAPLMVKSSMKAFDCFHNSSSIGSSMVKSPMKAFTDFVVLLASTAVDGAVSHESIYCFCGSFSIGRSRWCGFLWKTCLVRVFSWHFNGRLLHEICMYSVRVFLWVFYRAQVHEYGKQSSFYRMKTSW